MSATAKLMRQAAKALKKPQAIAADTPIKVGLDLGTAFTVLVVTDEAGTPLAVASQFADVVRDGVVWDFAGARQVVYDLKAKLTQATGRELVSAAVTVPPAVEPSNHRAHHYVAEGAGLECDAVIDETTAANAVLKVRDGAVVDVGGGTTGVAILRDGQVVANVDEPTGGTHVSLVISGALGIDFAEAERRKKKPAQHAELLPLVRPTFEKIGDIVARAIDAHAVETIHLVGGTAHFAALADIISQRTGVQTLIAPEPMLVTPLGVASWAKPQKGGH